LTDRPTEFESATLPHLRAAFNLARWLLRDDQHAQDVVQEAFLRAFRFFDGLRGADARPWLLGIVRNACYDWMRHNAAIADTLVFDELRDSDAAEPTSVGIDPARLLEQRALRGRVNAAIEALAPPFREVIVLRELEEMSYEEIAHVAGIPIGTVMSRLSRARAALRVALQDEAANSNLGGQRDANA
jgi:RNA polymerase sigma factor (sigma-70 family)